MTATAQEALAMLTRGDTHMAKACIEAACQRRDPDALAMRALWRVEGRLLPRDLAAARTDLKAAADRQHSVAARMLAGLLAAGAGGPREWQGALDLLGEWKDRDPLAARQLHLIARMDVDAEGAPLRTPKFEDQSAAPLVRTFRAFLTPDECAFLIELAERRLRPAVIFHEGKGGFVPDPIRNSDAAAFPILSENPFIHAINRRIAHASGTTPDQGEPLQLLRYRPGQHYRAHLDALPGLSNQRILTFLVYLSDDLEGGETRFTRLGIDIAPRRGDGLLFSNSLPDGRPDPMSEHAGQPVRDGVKHVASRWIRQRPADPAQGFGQHEIARA